MAYVSVGWEYSITVVDAGNNAFTRVFKLNSADATEALADATTVRTAYMAATDCVLSTARLSEVFVDDNYSLPANVEGENQAMIVFQLDGDARKKATFFVPGAKIGLFVAPQGKNRNVVDIQDAEVLALRALYDDATGVATISDGETALSVESGKRVHKGSTRG